ncbi:MULTISPECIES: replication-relaxation family protein [unclassified Frankia]|uniref:replication-relaxation family protein n=1 Tax=unclassified Frankia TaxID=2632575 RepID=UPI002AD24875|nr:MULTISPECIES: replication-relaxation family protein [unclassified Frankia]
MITNPPPQRALRAPLRPAARVVADPDHQLFLARRLSARDRWIARLLYEHRVLTTHQLVELAWPTRRAANQRLLELYRWRVLDRFQPLLPLGTGRAPAHYVLDVAGATVLAAEDGIDPRETGYRHERAIAIAHSLRLAHTVAVNGLFTSLVAHARGPHPAGTLTAWWSETRCLRAFGDIARPDAYGRWRPHDTDGEIEWFLELDYGTEPLTRLALKIGDYHRLAAATGITTPVLIWFPSAQREASARGALTAALDGLDQPATVPVATTAATLTPADPLDPTRTRWLPLPPARAGRLAVGELPRAWPHLPRPAASPARPAGTTPPGRGLRPPAPMPPTPHEE